MTERNEHKNEEYQDGDIYLNPCFGDLWVVDGTSFIKINNGYAIDLDEPEGFIIYILQRPATSGDGVSEVKHRYEL